MIIMILPLTASFDYEIENVPALDLSRGDEFEIERWRIDLTNSAPLSKNQLSLLCDRLLKAYRKEFPRLPLYILLKDSQIELIRDLSRLGALAYLGEWRDKSEEESARDWEAVTKKLRALDKEN